MSKPVFDAGSFLEVNLESGTISSKGKDRLALVSLDILSFLPSGDAVYGAAQEWGKRHGMLLADELGREDDAGVETLSAHLGGTVAALGMGRLRVEFRGDAMLFRVESSFASDSSEGVFTLFGGFLSGYLSALTGLPFQVLNLGGVSGGNLFWAGNPETAAAVRNRLNAGVAPFAAMDEAATRGLPC